MVINYCILPACTRNEFKSSIESLQVAEAGGEKPTALYEKRGKSFYQTQDFIGTITDLEKVIQTGSPDIISLEYVGIAYMQQQKNITRLFTYYMDLAETTQGG